MYFSCVLGSVAKKKEKFTRADAKKCQGDVSKEGKRLNNI